MLDSTSLLQSYNTTTPSPLSSPPPPLTHTPQILSPSHLLSAIFLSLHLLSTSRAKTRTPHSELVFRLSPNNNIGESYKKFGISDTTTTIIAVKLPVKVESSADEGAQVRVDESITAESVSTHLGGVVHGTSVEVGEEGVELGAWCAVEKVRMVYKLSGEVMGKKGKKGGGVNGAGPERDERKELESVVLGIIALKGS